MLLMSHIFRVPQDWHMCYYTWVYKALPHVFYQCVHIIHPPNSKCCLLVHYYCCCCCYLLTWYDLATYFVLMAFISNWRELVDNLNEAVLSRRLFSDASRAKRQSWAMPLNSCSVDSNLSSCTFRSFTLWWYCFKSVSNSDFLENVTTLL